MQLFGFKKRRKRKNSDLQKAKGLLNPMYVAVPVTIGLIVVAVMFFRDFSNFDLSAVRLTGTSVFFFLVALLCMVGRDFGLTWRFRVLTGHEVSWLQALRVNLLCEFTSAVTPSTVGGSSFGMIYLKGEGVNLGKATTIMMTTLFLDELFFVLACPAVLTVIPLDALMDAGSAKFSQTLRCVFWIVYAGLAIWTVILFWGIFIRPQVLKVFFNKLFSLRLLRKWKVAALEMGDNIISTSVDLKRRKLWWWIRAFFATALSWLSRYAVVNAIFLAFAIDADQTMVLFRQLVVWVVLTIAPTPGGSGVSEWLFTQYYGSMIPAASLALIMAFCWRIVSYYVYLVVGLCVFPSWLRGWVKRIRSAKKTEINNGNNE